MRCLSLLDAVEGLSCLPLRFTSSLIDARTTAAGRPSDTPTRKLFHCARPPHQPRARVSSPEAVGLETVPGPRTFFGILMLPPELHPSFLRPIAHRGLHGKGLVENSGPAFEAAIVGGYGIECDLQALADGTPMVFHDETLERLVDATGRLDALTPKALARLRYRGTDTPILSFAGLLELVGGAVPLLVEIKSAWGPPVAGFLEQIASLATAYRGPVALMSFDPAVMAAMKRLAPGVARGLVSGSYRAVNGDNWWADRLTPERAEELRELADFEWIGASFAAYECGALPTARTRELRARGVPVLTWTVRTDVDRARAAAHADAMIFEGFEA